VVFDLLKPLARLAPAGSGVDVQILQTAASIENLAVATYAATTGLPFMEGVPALVKTFLPRTKDQHTEHARQFNAAVSRLGGKAQDGPNPELKKLVDGRTSGLRTAGDVIDLLLTLEIAAAQTYVANTAALEDVDARKLTASVMGVAAQYVSTLNLIKALLPTPELLVPQPALSRVPAAAAVAALPDGSFLKTGEARPVDEGALK
jgi:ferritin-like protein